MQKNYALFFKLFLCFTFITSLTLFCACKTPEVKVENGLVYTMHKDELSISLETGASIENLLITSKTPELVLEDFCNQPSLKSITIDLPNAKKLTFAKKSFENCPNLQSITINVNQSCEILMKKKAFWACEALRTITFNGGETDMATKSFYCPNLENVYVNNGKLLYVTPLLKYSTNVKNVTLDNGYVYFWNNYYNYQKERLNIDLTIENVNLNNGSKWYFAYKHDAPYVKNMYFSDDFTFENSEVYSLRYDGFMSFGKYYEPVAQNIYLNKNCGNIPAKFFGEKGSATLYFNGSEEEWNALTIEEEENNSYFFDNIKVVTLN